MIRTLRHAIVLAAAFIMAAGFVIALVVMGT